MNYDKRIFMWYVNTVVAEMNNRDVTYSIKIYLELKDFCNIADNHWLIDNYPEHNKVYLQQCFYNLQEKCDRGIITTEEFDKVKNVVEEELR